MPLRRLTPAHLRLLTSRLVRVEVDQGLTQPDSAPASSPDDLRSQLSVLWEAGALYTPPGVILPPQWQDRADGQDLRRLGQRLAAAYGLSPDELEGRDQATGLWRGELACRRLVGMTPEDTRRAAWRRGADDGD
jgi:hypothetical protein